jgi:hypothetical protein
MNPPATARFDTDSMKLAPPRYNWRAAIIRAVIKKTLRTRHCPSVTGANLAHSEFRPLETHALRACASAAITARPVVFQPTGRKGGVSPFQTATRRVAPRACS